MRRNAMMMMMMRDFQTIFNLLSKKEQSRFRLMMRNSLLDFDCTNGRKHHHRRQHQKGAPAARLVSPRVLSKKKKKEVAKRLKKRTA